MNEALAVGLTGFATGISLILAIGAQNAFVLRQGLLRSHVFIICLICASSDAVLIVGGVIGFGAATEQIHWLTEAMRWGGVVFLAIYGITRFRAAWLGGHRLENAEEVTSLSKAVLLCLAFTWLNPHVYLDTFGLIGAISTQYSGDAKLWFSTGAVSASFIFFYALGYGARVLSPLMQRPNSWRVLDAMIGVVMWMIALNLFWMH